MRPTILVCDDEDVLRSLIRATFNDKYEVHEAKDGQEALEQARKVEPDLIVLDMMMPGKSGLDVMAELRADRALAETPIVMLTARTRAADRHEALAVGADRYIAKPFSPLELAEIVHTLLRPSGEVA